LLQNWLEDSLTTYRPELIRILWPIFVHSVLNLAGDFYPTLAKRFFEKFHGRFEQERHEELRQLSVLALPEHVDSSEMAKTYRGAKYRVTMTKMAYSVLLQFLESNDVQGGDVIMRLINDHISIVDVPREKIPERSLAAMLNRHGEEYDIPAEDEGIPGHQAGSAITSTATDQNLPKLNLGPRPISPDLMEDVRAGLEEQDAKMPPQGGEPSLVELFEEKIKREPDDGPNRDTVPLPPSVARDVAMEMTRIREHRDRYKIDPRSGGTAPGISVVMYTFHNTHDR